MYRSSSSTRVSDEYFASTSPTQSVNYASVDHLLPTYNSPQQASRKEKTRIRSAENVVHLIPLLLIVCTIILWFFSTPVDLVGKGEHSLVTRDSSSITSGHVNSDIKKGVANSSKVLSEDNLRHFDLNDQSEDKDPAN